MGSPAHLGGTGEPLPDELVVEPEVDVDPVPELGVLLVSGLLVPEVLEADPPLLPVLVEPDVEPVDELPVDELVLVLVPLVVELSVLVEVQELADEELPVDEVPVEELPVGELSVEEFPVEELPVEELSVEPSVLAVVPSTTSVQAVGSLVPVVVGVVVPAVDVTDPATAPPPVLAPAESRRSRLTGLACSSATIRVFVASDAAVSASVCTAGRLGGGA
jgi:hypothetical protein